MGYIGDVIFMAVVFVHIKFINPPTIQKPLFFSTYDYVIVGGGSAGSVIARRLIENNPFSTILLLEAGEDDQKVESEIPAAAPRLFRSSEDWSYLSTPQQNSCLLVKNRQCTIPRGKVIGGCSTINFMMYVRGNPQDYDNWALARNKGWSYTEILPYFLKSEDYKGEINEETRKYHGTGGPLTVTPLIWKTPITDTFLNTLKDLNHTIGDYNSANQLAFKEIDFTIRNGARCSAAKAFLKPMAITGYGLFISLNSLVKKINIDKNTLTATSVTFIKNGKENTVLARKEVILSAGAIGSPQLLLLSGIGPRKHLEEKKIDVIVDLPGVGQNYQEHVAMPAIFTTGKLLSQEKIEELKSSASQLEWIQGTGPLTTPMGVEVTGFLKTKFLPSNATYPDIQLNLQTTPWTEDTIQLIKEGFLYIKEFFGDYLSPVLNKESFSLFAVLLNPKSRGYIELNTTDINDQPVIQPNYFQNSDDIKTLTEGMKEMIKIGNSSRLRELGFEPYTAPLPGCEKWSFGTDNFWECAIRHVSLIIHHSSCTCKMGPKSDNMAVVDERLRVHGINKLRIIDASVMPKIVSGNTNAPTIMIAEKAADMILEDNN